MKNILFEQKDKIAIYTVFYGKSIRDNKNVLKTQHISLLPEYIK